MAVSVEDHEGGTTPPEDVDQSWIHLRQRARELLRNQGQWTRQLESELGQQVETLLHQVGQERESAAQQIEQLQQRIEELEQDGAGGAAGDETNALLEEARVALSEALREQQELKIQLRNREDEVHAYRTQLLEGDSGDVSAQLVELQAERDRLESRLAEAERQLESAEADGGDSERFNEMRERFETAVQEVRQLKSENDELNRMLAEGAGRDPDETPPDGFDWESQKQRLMAQLESDFDTSDAEQAQGKLTVEGAIRITDQVVAKKEQEISELRLLLEDQSAKVGEVAVGASAVAAMLDNDELVQVERENLKRLQDEWREKLRQAEVDISIERAKLARERVTLEEKIQAFEDGQAAVAAQAPPPPDGSTEEPRKSPGGNWLARLGLKSDEDEEAASG